MRRSPDRRSLREFIVPALVVALAIAVLALLETPATPPADAGSPAGLQAPAPMQELRLRIPRKGMLKLRLQREAALATGILMHSDNAWVRATLIEGTSAWPVKLRLKGDWTDHLQAGKWSFRIQMPDSLAYRRMSAFSLQSPATREFLNEWLFHEVLREEGILTTRYDFVRLRLNGNMLGVYALEEHFTQEMLPAQHRPEGPLLKFSEEGMWEARVRALQDTFFPYVRKPLFESAHPEAFQYARLLRDSTRAAQHHAALNAMAAYQQGAAPPAALFDLDATARQLALIDVFGGHHSLIWHNRRFYFDPVGQRLHPVVFDAYAGSGTLISRPFTGYAARRSTSYGLAEDILTTQFFADTAFVAAYYRYLHTYADSAWISATLARHQSEIQRREAFVRREFLGYRHDPAPVLANAAAIRSALRLPPPGGLRWDSIPLPEGGWRYCVENLSPLALRVGGVLLDAWDVQGCPDWEEMEGNTRPSVEVAGSEWRLSPRRGSGSRIW